MTKPTLVVDQHGVEDTVFCEVNITTCYSTAKFAHMNGHWKAYDIIVGLPVTVHVRKLCSNMSYSCNVIYM